MSGVPAPRGASRTDPRRISVVLAGTESLRCQIEGPISYPAILALERIVSVLSGVTMVSVVPSDGGHATLTMTCRNPNRTLYDLQHLADFPLRLEGP
jgi:hypothetical protein